MCMSSEAGTAPTGTRPPTALPWTPRSGSRSAASLRKTPAQLSCFDCKCQSCCDLSREFTLSMAANLQLPNIHHECCKTTPVQSALAKLPMSACAHAQVADMKQERGSLGVAEVGGHIYAMGGGRGDQTSVNMDTVEVFTPDLNAWHAGPKMHEQRFTTSAAPVNGAIYITGGFDGGNYLRTAERLDPRQGAWQPVRPAFLLALCVSEG